MLELDVLSSMIIQSMLERFIFKKVMEIIRYDLSNNYLIIVTIN